MVNAEQGDHNVELRCNGTEELWRPSTNGVLSMVEAGVGTWVEGGSEP